MKGEQEMRGSLSKRSKSSWTIRLTLGRKIDPKTGKSKINQKTITVRGTKQEAEAKLAELLNQYNKGEYIEPTTLTTGEWLQRWIDVYVKNSRKKRLRTIETYESVVRRHLIPAFDKIPLQKLSAGHIQHYYNTSLLSSSTEEDWYYNYQVHGYVFEKADFTPLFLTDKEPAVVSLKMVATPSVVYYNDKYDAAYLNDIAVKINEELEKENYHDLYLMVNVMKLEDALRFIMVEKSVSVSGKYEFETYSGLYATDWDLPIKLKEAVTVKVFKNFYFEADYQAFIDFWNR